MRRWFRPYGQDDLHTLRTIFAGFMSAAGLFPLCYVASKPDAATLAVIGGFFVLWEVMLWRRILVGVYVSDFGVKVRRVNRTHLVPWSRVDRAWAGQAADYDAWQIWISVLDPARDIETPIWRKGSRAGHRNRIVLPPDEFATTLEALDPRRSSFNGSRATTGG